MASDGGASRPLTVLVAHPSVDLYGSDRMLLESVRALSQRMHVVVSFPLQGPLSEECRPYADGLVIRDVPVLRKARATPWGAFLFGFQALMALPGLVRLLRRLRIDVVYVNTLTVPTWLLAARIARVGCVCHVHEAETGVPKIIGLALALPLMLTRTVIANSEATAQWLVTTIGRLASRTSVVYNGIAPPEEPLPEPRETLTPPVRLLLVGRLSPRKGTDTAIEALALLRLRGINATLAVVGDAFTGYQWFEDELRRRTTHLGLKEHVDFRGFMSDIWPAHAEADIVVMPSRAEPFGNAAVEAMLAQRPVVASDVQGLGEIVTMDKTGKLVPPDSPGALADAVTALVEDWPQARALALRAREEAMSRFTLDVYDLRIRTAVEEARAR